MVDPRLLSIQSSYFGTGNTNNSGMSLNVKFKLKQGCIHVDYAPVTFHAVKLCQCLVQTFGQYCSALPELVQKRLGRAPHHYISEHGFRAQLLSTVVAVVLPLYEVFVIYFAAALEDIQLRL